MAFPINPSLQEEHDTVDGKTWEYVSPGTWIDVTTYTVTPKTLYSLPAKIPLTKDTDYHINGGDPVFDLDQTVNTNGRVSGSITIVNATSITNISGITINGDAFDISKTNSIKYIAYNGVVSDFFNNVQDATVVSNVSSGATITKNSANNYIRLDSPTDEDFTVTSTTLSVGEQMIFRGVSTGLPNLLSSGVTLNDPKGVNGISVELGLICVALNSYDVI